MKKLLNFTLILALLFAFNTSYAVSGTYASLGKTIDQTSLDLKQGAKKSKLSKKKIKRLQKIQKKIAKKQAKGGKSQVVALLLVLFFGVLGIHRFYLGHNLIGVLMLLTAGLFGILALIDLVRIIIGSLKPKDGDYETKL